MFPIRPSFATYRLTSPRRGDAIEGARRQSARGTSARRSATVRELEDGVRVISLADGDADRGRSEKRSGFRTRTTSKPPKKTEDAYEKYLRHKAKHEEYSGLLAAGPHGKVTTKSGVIVNPKSILKSSAGFESRSRSIPGLVSKPRSRSKSRPYATTSGSTAVTMFDHEKYIEHERQKEKKAEELRKGCEKEEDRRSQSRRSDAEDYRQALDDAELRDRQEEEGEQQRRDHEWAGMRRREEKKRNQKEGVRLCEEEMRRREERILQDEMRRQQMARVRNPQKFRRGSVEGLERRRFRSSE